MKVSRLLPSVVVFCWCASVCVSAELRTVGSAQVDIQPLLDWAAKGKGERPLKHWKFVQVLEHRKQSTFPVLFCDIEGLQSEIMLKNCPRELLGLIDQKKKLEAELASIRQERKVADEALQKARTKKGARKARQVERAESREEKTVQRELDDVAQKIKRQGKICAMFTGTTVGGVPIWDTGLPGH